MKTDDLFHQGSAGPKIRSAGNAARKDQHVIFVPVQMIDGGIGDHSDVMGSDDDRSAADRNAGTGNARAKQNVGYSQGLDGLTAVGEKEGNFAVGYGI